VAKKRRLAPRCYVRNPVTELVFGKEFLDGHGVKRDERFCVKFDPTTHLEFVGFPERKRARRKKA
jgi:hypothetical protein